MSARMFWAKLAGARKYHLFRDGDGRSLCDRYAAFISSTHPAATPATAEDNLTDGDCLACWAKRRRLDAGEVPG